MVSLFSRGKPVNDKKKELSLEENLKSTGLSTERQKSKTCHLCRREFIPTTLRQRYCRQSGCRSYHGPKRNKGSASLYQKYAFIKNAMNRFRKKARYNLTAMTIVKCYRCHIEITIGEADIQHLDGNPFNVADENVRWSCRKCNQETKATEKHTTSAENVEDLLVMLEGFILDLEKDIPDDSDEFEAAEVEVKDEDIPKVSI